MYYIWQQRFKEIEMSLKVVKTIMKKDPLRAESLLGEAIETCTEMSQYSSRSSWSPEREVGGIEKT